MTLPHFNNIKSAQEIWAIPMSEEEVRTMTKARLKKTFEKDMSLLNEIIAEFRKEKIQKIKEKQNGKSN